MSLAGGLEDLSISDIFHILSVGRKTGRLIVWGARGTAGRLRSTEGLF